MIRSILGRLASEILMLLWARTLQERIAFMSATYVQYEIWIEKTRPDLNDLLDYVQPWSQTED